MTDTIITEKVGNVVRVQLNRPEALNALNLQLLEEVSKFLSTVDSDPEIGCIVLHGSERAFAAGADIIEMQDQSFVNMFMTDWFAGWEKVANVRTPMIAAVSGYALGGGCELAMIADMIFAAENAKFGQPEIKLGVIPGMGGSQRLTHAVGKAKATDLILTGRFMDAEEAEKSGLVARVIPTDKLLEVTMEAAEEIASYSKPALFAAKESIARAMEVSLAEGLLFERRVFHSLFATEDQKEGMKAFAEKRKPEFKGR